MNEPIAIVGMSCRFPQAETLDAFWQILAQGVDAIGEVPPSRYDVNALHDQTPLTPGKIASREGGFLRDIDLFDAEFFGIPPREAAVTDPQQRLVLETAWEALEDAGQTVDRLRGSQTGVFIGIWINDYEDRMYANNEDMNLYVATGGGRYAASGRLSYFFDFNGPSLTVDTACSSSLVATHLALQSLWSGESKLALAGGVNLILVPQITVGYSRSGMLSPDGRCKFGDAAANGYVRSEGVGMLVLKPLAQAQADGDTVHAVIRGSAVNNDGRSSELLVAPSPRAQAAMLRAAYRAAGVAPAEVQYIEAHGTGTRVGDPVELEALGQVLGAGRAPDSPCFVGSVKTNIGHTEAVSGIAGLIKTVLSLKHRQIPPSLHLHELNPAVPWGQVPLVIPRELTPWPAAAHPAYAGVSSFGVTGTNAHIVLEAAPAPAPRVPAADADKAYLLPLSARHQDALLDLARRYLALAPGDSLRDVAFTASVRRTHLEQRLAVVARDWDELREHLTAFVAGERLRGLAVGPASAPAARKIAFVFSGQGGQWAGMGRQLAQQEPVFRAALERCQAALQPYTDWLLLDELNAPEDQSRLDEIDVIQPAIFAIQVALAELWRAWGVEPDAVIGHSMGEVAAACAAGALSLEDGARVICYRSQLMKRVSGHGAMALVELAYAAAVEAVETMGFADRLGAAVSNGPTSTVLSGDADSLRTLVARLEDEGVFCRFVKVDVAAHSPHMDALRPLLVSALQGLTAQDSSIPIYSTVLGARLAGSGFDAAYWGQNLRQPVLFSAAIEQALAAGCSAFIEFSPHPVLLAAIERGYGADQPLLTLPAMRRDEDGRATLLASLGELYAAGWAIDWPRLFPEGGNLVRLPAYPWQKERFWFAEADEPARRRGRGEHPLLDQHLTAHDGVHYWATEVDIALLPYLADHQVQGRIVFPAAAYVEMALGAAHTALGAARYRVDSLVFDEALFLSRDAATSVQVTLTPQMAARWAFAVYARQGEGWTRHAHGTVIHDEQQEAADHEPLAALQARLGGALAPGGAHYQRMRQRSLGYGSAFQGVAALAAQDGEGLAALRLPEAALNGGGAYQIHPALLDACFQLLLAASRQDDQAAYMPVELRSVTLYSRPAGGAALHAYARVEQDADGVLAGDVRLLDEAGRLLMLASGLRMKRLERQTGGLDDWLYQVAWLPVDAGAVAPPDTSGRWLVFADAQGVGDALATRLSALGEQTVVVYADAAARAAADAVVLNPADPADFARLARAQQADWRGVVYLWALDAAEDDLPGSAERIAIGALHLTQMLARAGAAPRLWLVTQGAQPVLGSVTAAAQASLWGLGAVLSNEHPEMRPVRLDLDPAGGDIELLLRELWAAPGEDQLAYRGQQRYAARLAPLPAAPAGAGGEICEVAAAQQPFRAEVTAPGVLENLRFRALTRRPPGPGEVEIEVVAAGLNFMNVLSALGICPGYADGVGPLGIECAGRVAAVGAGVDQWRVGDEVVAVAFDSLATHATADARLVARKPARLSFEDAATIPIVFLTAYYALDYQARLQAGERVLIHAGAGGVGLAAIQLAQRAGAEVWATAGTPEKRAFLHTLGVRAALDSRSLAFADAIMAATAGEGVDVVLNSLAGEAIARGLELLRPYGRFVEIGKRDIYDNSSVGLLPFSRNLSYFAVDLDKMARERPQVLGAMLDHIMALVEAGELQPLPATVFPAAEAAEAFRYMAQGKHIGKIVIALQAGSVPVFVPAASPVRADASYLITGGLGGLGLTVAHWLAGQGARQIVLSARRGPGAQAQAEIDALRAAGVDVQVMLADVSDGAAVSQLVRAIQQRLLPLRGVFHAAGVLDDGMMAQLDAARFHAVMAPKVAGAWHLHAAAQAVELDWFVLFSSVTAVLGTPGQANYAAGNAFMDGLAHYRRSLGLPALSINWGPWAEVGLAAAQANRGERLAARGVGSIAPQDGAAALARLLTQAVAQAAVMPFNASQWAQAYAPAAQSSLLADLLQADEGPAGAAEAEQAEDIRAAFAAAESHAARLRLLENLVREQVGAVMSLAAARVDVQRPLRTMGLDSLMTLELRNRLEGSLRLKLPATLVFNYPTVAALAAYLAERLGEAPAKAATAAGEAQASADDMDGLTQAEVEALLADELAALDDLLKGI